MNQRAGALSHDPAATVVKHHFGFAFPPASLPFLLRPPCVGVVPPTTA